MTVLYCHICNVTMKLSAKHLVTQGSYSEGVLLTVRILGCEEIFLSSVAKYCVWVKNSFDDALGDIVVTWHIQISYFICTLYTKHIRYSLYRTSLQHRTSFSSFALVFPFFLILGNANVEQEYLTLYKQVAHVGEISDDHFL